MKNKERLETLKKIGFKGIKKYLLLLDIIYCNYFLHTSDKEYFLYDFYKLKNKYRKRFLLIYHQRNLYKEINPNGFTRDKYKNYLDLKPFFAREIIKVPECGMQEFIEFVKKHKKVILKPIDGSLGKGIAVYNYSDENAAISQFIYLNDKKYLCEEFIKQNSVLNNINPYSVNTIRLVSLFSENRPQIISATLRMGATKGCIDNLKSGGIGAVVDVNNGTVISVGKNYNNEDFIKHPVSNIEILGIKIPNWSKVIKLIEEAHKIYSECPILGWDIAITKDSAVLVELNNAPGPMIMQYIDKIPKGDKIFEFAKKYLNKKPM